jgi:beta-lactamase regulating signal transducer with metallopeptidase domain
MVEHFLATWLFTYAAHAALFAALAAVAERTRWGAAPARRDALWKLALVGGVLTSTLFVAAGSAPSGAAVHLSPEGVIAPALETTWLFWLVLGWISITTVLALRSVRVWCRGVQSAGRRRVMRRGAARAILDGILGSAADRVTLTCSRTLGAPVAFAREICVPVRALRELPHDELRALLAHEAAHIVRRDAGWLMIAAAVRTLGWWQPLTLVASARLRLAMELCCDERAAVGSHQRAALARCLVRVAEWNVEDHGPALAAMASRRSALRRRLDSLLDDAPRRDRCARPWLSVTLVGLPVVCLAPVVTVADLSRVPAAAARLVPQAHASIAPTAVPTDRSSTRRSRRQTDRVRAPAPRVEPPPSPALPNANAPAPVLVASSLGLPVAASAVASPPPTPLQNAIAAARVEPGVASPRPQFGVSDRERRMLKWIAQQRNILFSFDPNYPTYGLR